QYRHHRDRQARRDPRGHAAGAQRARGRRRSSVGLRSLQDGRQRRLGGAPSDAPALAPARRSRTPQWRRDRGPGGGPQPRAPHARDRTAGGLTVTAASVDAWLAELSLNPVERQEREGVVSWDLLLDGRARRDIRVTLILEPHLAIVGWVHYAPPLSD